MGFFNHNIREGWSQFSLKVHFIIIHACNILLLLTQQVDLGYSAAYNKHTPSELVTNLLCMMSLAPLPTQNMSIQSRAYRPLIQSIAFCPSTCK